MFSLLFQFVGAVLLSWNQIIKRRYDLALEGKTLINNSPYLSKEKSIKILKNYYYNLLGFIFIALGYLFQIFEYRSEEHTSELQSRENLVCRLLLEKKKQVKI